MSSLSPRTLIHFGRGFTGMVLLCTPFGTWLSDAETGHASLVHVIYDCWLMMINNFSAAALIHNIVLTVCLLIVFGGSLSLIIPATTKLFRLGALGLGLLFVGSLLYFGAAVSSWGLLVYSAAALIGFALEAADAKLTTPEKPAKHIPFEPMHYMI